MYLSLLLSFVHDFYLRRRLFVSDSTDDHLFVPDRSIFALILTAQSSGGLDC